ncbi:hypothetical protein [Clostridioides difficile]|uniref:hypothetical protein n=1 Tax=Clostridioides difficile TaxID=1496 RepID=UPI001F343320|nr:hypothetical protein [Clostridioides difficile]
MVQDTAGDAYEEIPAFIMQGYATMAKEATDQLKDYGVVGPTPVFVEAGVRSPPGEVQVYDAPINEE